MKQKEKEIRKNDIRTCEFCTDGEKSVLLEKLEYGLSINHSHKCDDYEE